MVDERGEQSNVSFYQWACSRLHVTPNTINTCGFANFGVLAVGVDRLRLYNRSFYEALCDEFALYGSTGAVMGHFMERLWRSMFVRHCHFATCETMCTHPLTQGTPHQ